MASPPSCPRPEPSFIKEKRKAHGAAGAIAGVGTVQTEIINKVDQTDLSIDGFEMWLADAASDALGMEAQGPAGYMLHMADLENAALAGGEFG
jgi:hypothetical protein